MLRKWQCISLLRRWSSSKTPSINPVQWLEELSVAAIPQKEFNITFSRSSGPGGQKVNKTSSKSTVHLADLDTANWIPAEIRQQLKERRFRYLTKSNGVLIQSDQTRSRDQNTLLCFERLVSEIKTVVHFEKEISAEDKKRWKEINKRANEHRLLNKQRISEKKKLRREKITF